MGALDGTVNLPGMGSVPKKNVAIAGAVAGGIVGIGYYRKKKSDAAALAAGTNTGIDIASSDALGSTAPVGPGDLGGGSISTGGDPLPAPINLQNAGILTNQDWKSAAGSIDLGGIDSAVITAAASKALGGIAMTQAEVEIFQEIAGEIGYPPQGYPPIRLTTTTPGTPVPLPTPTPTPAPVTNTYNARNQSMYDVEKIAHGRMPAPDLNDLALRAIHYNMAHNRNWWPAGIPGYQLTQRKITGPVYVL